MIESPRPTVKGYTRSRSSAVERVSYTHYVDGSIPSGSTSIICLADPSLIHFYLVR